jgi:hypothetical protein
MFSYVRPTQEQQHSSLKVQARYDRQVARGLRAIRIETNMRMAQLRKRILKEREAYARRIPCPLLRTRQSANGAMVDISQWSQHASRIRFWPNLTQVGTSIPLADYWYTVLGQRRAESAAETS